jgi:hypothetical protein
VPEQPAGAAIDVAKDERIGEAAPRRIMSKNDEYRANAAECERMARFTRNESEKRTWQDMAESWLRLIQPSSAVASDRFNAMDLDQAAQASAGSEH